MQLKIKALSPKIGREIPAPFYASAGAAAMDLHACLDQAVTIPAGKRAVIPTGIAIALPSSEYVALVFARSGLGIKHGVAPANCVGVIDSDYRGEVMVPAKLRGSGLYHPARRPHRPADDLSRHPGPDPDGGGAGRHRPGRRGIRIHREITGSAGQSEHAPQFPAPTPTM